VAPKHSGQTSIFSVVFSVSKSLLGIERQTKHDKFAILTRTPRIHVRILIYRTWPIQSVVLNILLINIFAADKLGKFFELPDLISVKAGYTTSSICYR